MEPKSFKTQCVLNLNMSNRASPPFRRAFLPHLKEGASCSQHGEGVFVVFTKDHAAAVVDGVVDDHGAGFTARVMGVLRVR